MPAKRVYIAESLASDLTKLYPQKESGLNRAVNGFLAIRRLSLRGLRGRFSTAELVGLADAFNGVTLGLPSAVGPKFTLLTEMEDAERLSGSAGRYGYDALGLEAKLLHLTDPEAFFLLDELERFWNEENDLPNPDLRGFLAEYAAE